MKRKPQQPQPQPKSPARQALDMLHLGHSTTYVATWLWANTLREAGVSAGDLT